jgi:hypothetical protein
LTNRVDAAALEAEWAAAEANLLAEKDALVPKSFEQRLKTIQSQRHSLFSDFQEGDEVWWYTMPPKTRQSRGGCAGYALVRGGKVIADVLTLIS